MKVEKELPKRYTAPCHGAKQLKCGRVKDFIHALAVVSHVSRDSFADLILNKRF